MLFLMFVSRQSVQSGTLCLKKRFLAPLQTLNLLDLFEAVTSSAPATPPSPTSTPNAPRGSPPATSPAPIPAPSDRVPFIGKFAVDSAARTTGPPLPPGGPLASIRAPYGSVGKIMLPVSPPGTFFPVYGDAFSGYNLDGFGGALPSPVSYARSFPPTSTGQRSFEMASYARVMRPMFMV